MEKSYFGAMLDMSRKGVMTVEAVKKYADYLASFGYNMLQLYTEDTYEVENEPYFGYLRGRYTGEEIREIDAYCASKGIELIPCIQTLAHLGHIFKWKEYWQCRDTNDILLVGEERTYELIENMFRTLQKNFTSRKVHIGMDEAHFVGLGNYLHKHGYRNRFEILSEHLKRVVGIAKKYGFKPIMWSDMFFRLANDGEYCPENPAHFSADVVKSVPPEVDLVYWDYYHNECADYDKYIAFHRELKNPLWFAGGVWTWGGGFAPLNAFAFGKIRASMQSCRKNGISNILMTLWGDDGAECSYFSVLPALYAAKRLYDGETRISVIKREFNQLTGEDYDKLSALSAPNDVFGEEKRGIAFCKWGLYNDPLLGIADESGFEGGKEEFSRAARRLRRTGKTGELSYLFETEAALCDALAVKFDLGKRLRAAYRSGKERLNALIPDIIKAKRLVKKFHDLFRKQWLKERKPFGFEQHDQRLGGLEARLGWTAELVGAYCRGERDRIEEFETELLDGSQATKFFNAMIYADVAGTET